MEDLILSPLCYSIWSERIEDPLHLPGKPRESLGFLPNQISWHREIWLSMRSSILPYDHFRRDHREERSTVAAHSPNRRCPVKRRSTAFDFRLATLATLFGEHFPFILVIYNMLFNMKLFCEFTVWNTLLEWYFLCCFASFSKNGLCPTVWMKIQ